MSPMEQTVVEINRMKTLKEGEKLLKEKIKKRLASEPNSKEKNAALTFRYITDRKKLEELLPNITSHHNKERNRLKNLSKNHNETNYYHTGKWGKTIVDSREIWSCCASEIKDYKVAF